MKKLQPIGQILGPLLIVLPPLVVALFWAQWALRVVDLHEQAIAPVLGGGFSPFIQIAWAWNEGLGWVQTVRWEPLQLWCWDQHWGPLFIPIAWVSGFWESAWTLARIQVVLVSLGCLSAWLLGWAEARFTGAVAGLLIYACSGPLIVIALADYQNLTLALPLLPLAVWAARHASTPVFLVVMALLGSVREELLLLVPLVGLTGGVHRAVLAALVSAGWAAVLHGWAGFLSGNSATVTVVGESWLHLVQAGLDFLPRIDWGHYLQFAGTGLIWLFMAPLYALSCWAIAGFQYMPGAAAITGPGWNFVHHLAPLVGMAICGGIVGVGRLMRAAPWARPLLLLAVVGWSLYSLSQWNGHIVNRGIRAGGAGTHPAWQLLEQVPDDAVLLVPSTIAPAAARRRWLVMPQSLGHHVLTDQVTHAIDNGRSIEEEMPPEIRWRPQGRVEATQQQWQLRVIEPER